MPASWSQQHRVNNHDFAFRNLTLLFDSCVTSDKLLTLSLCFRGNTTYLADCWAVNEVRWVKGSGHSLAHNRCSLNALFFFLRKCWCGELFCWVSGFFGSQGQEKFWGTTGQEVPFGWQELRPWRGYKLVREGTQSPYSPLESRDRLCLRAGDPMWPSPDYFCTSPLTSPPTRSAHYPHSLHPTLPL